MTMTPKNSDYSSDESQPSEMEVEIPCSRPVSSVNTTEVVSPPRSSDNSSVSPSGSSVSSSVVSYCDTHKPVSNNGRNKRKHETFPASQKSSGNKVTDSVSSLSVPSSPEPTISPCSKEQHVKESPVAYLYETRSHNHNHHPNRFSYGELPRTAPCIVLSPSNSSSNPVLFSHHNPGATYNPSSLIMPVPPPFQMFHHHQSTLMSKINPLCFKTVDVGMQRFREFCADHNFNSVGSGFMKPTKCVDDNVETETGNEEKDFNNVIRNCGDKKPTKEYEKQGEREDMERNDKSLRSQSPPAVMKRLSFGIDAILAEGKCGGTEKASERSSEGLLDEEQGSHKDQISKRSLVSPSVTNTRQPILYQNPNNNHHHHHPLNHSASPDHSHRLHSLSSASQSPLNLTNRCADCYLLGRFCRNNGTSSNLHYPSLVSSSSGVNGGGGVGGSTNGVSASFSPWMTNASIYENSPLLSPSAYHTQSTLTSAYNMGSAGYSTMSSLVSCNNNGPGGRRKRSWSRAVFSSLQRKGLEKRFQIQKYITKPDRRQLAATLGLTDAQVKVWFQNRRMKWRHSKEGKVTSGIGDEGISVSTTVISSASNSSGSDGHRSLPVGAASSSSPPAIDVKT